MSNEEIIWSFLNERIKNPYGTAGLMGNLFAESSLNPILANNVKKKTGLTNEEYTAIVDAGKNDNFATDGIAYGIVQWYYHTRKMNLLNKSREANKSIGDIHLQLQFLWEEIQAYKTVVNTLYSAKSVREASDIVLLKYEKPASMTETVKVKRAAYGQKYFDKYAIGIKVATKLSRKAATELKNNLEQILR